MGNHMAKNALVVTFPLRHLSACPSKYQPANASLDSILDQISIDSTPSNPVLGFSAPDVPPHGGVFKISSLTEPHHEPACGQAVGN